MLTSSSLPSRRRHGHTYLHHNPHGKPSPFHMSPPADSPISWAWHGPSVLASTSLSMSSEEATSGVQIKTQLLQYINTTMANSSIFLTWQFHLIGARSVAYNPVHYLSASTSSMCTIHCIVIRYIVSETVASENPFTCNGVSHFSTKLDLHQAKILLSTHVKLQLSPPMAFVVPKMCLYESLKKRNKCHWWRPQFLLLYAGFGWGVAVFASHPLLQSLEQAVLEAWIRERRCRFGLWALMFHRRSELHGGLFYED